MARNGSGTMSIDYADFQSGANIVADELDANFSTIVAELTNSVAVDGQSTMSGDLAMGTNKITGVGDPTSAQDVVTKAYFEANASAGGGLQSMQVFTAGGTWTKPAGITTVKVTVVGGGGGGGGGNSGDVGASGGGGGGNAIEYIDVTGTSSETITIGAAGSAGSAGGSGGAGGTSSFGAFCSATGGSGGVSNGTTVVSGGSGSGGDININGGYGGAPGGSGTERKYTNNNGGSSLFGFGASSDSFGGDAGVGYGAGGNGGVGGGAVGGAGTAGIIIVEEYA